MTVSIAASAALKKCANRFCGCAAEAVRQHAPKHGNGVIGASSHFSNRFYFTNADQMRQSDPYASLGLEWGATAAEIKDAYRRLARELHPDVSHLEPAEALNRFRAVKEAYDTLMNDKVVGAHRTDLWEEWSFAVWRGGDLIAQERTDVAGALRKRSAKPAASDRRRGWGVASLGHPDGRGAAAGRRGELLDAAGGSKGQRSSTVGTGRSKWVEKREF